MSLRYTARRKLQEAAVGLAGAAALALLAEGGRRAFPRLIPSKADANWILRYLAGKPGAPLEYSIQQEEMQMGLGRLVFKEQGHWLLALNEPIKGKKEAEDPFGTEPLGTLTIYALTGGSEALRKLTKATKAFFAGSRKPSLSRWSGSVWETSFRVRPRPLSSVALPEGVAESALTDMRNFLADEQWYKDRHIPYRRGMLFYGPPGSGKTTLASALAHELGLNSHVISLSDKKLTDSMFLTALQHMGDKAVLVLEDIDAMNAQVERRVEAGWAETELQSDDGQSLLVSTPTPGGSLTLAGILNALDGLGTPHGLLTIMTTNHPERLDPALVRPGRVDFRLEIGFADRDQARQLYARFFPEETKDGWDEVFAQNIQPGVHSPAEIQEHLLRHRKTPIIAAAGL